jgi:hypothetical protein
MMNQQVRDNGNILKNFERGGTFFVASGITGPANVIMWEATETCSVQFIKGYRVGGTGATINARKNGTLNHQSVALSLVTADLWTPGAAIINPNYIAGDKLEIMLVSVTGSPTQVAIVVGFTF